MIVVSYPLLTLFPFNWNPPRAIPNGAVLEADGRVRFATRGIAETPAPPAWIAEAMSSGQLSVQLRARSASTTQGGPARLFTLSADAYHRNLTIGQEGENLAVRLRTSWSDDNGMPELIIPGVFDAEHWHDLELDVQPGRMLVRVDGEIRAQRPLPPAPFHAWDRSYRLALGNELTLDRPWLGEIAGAVVRTPKTRAEYTGPGALLVVRPRLWLFNRMPHLVPFRAASLGDVLANILFFVPFGFMLAMNGRPLTLRRGFRVVLYAFLLSATLESLQFLVPERQPSVDDLLTNSVGAALGLALFVWLRARHTRLAKTLQSVWWGTSTAPERLG